MQTNDTLLNPLISFRHTLNLTQARLAQEAGLGVVIIELQEKGIPHHLHPRFLAKFPDAVELITPYQEFRVAQRRHNFPDGSLIIPETGPEFTDWLRRSGLPPNVFSEKACMPMVDISYTIHHWRIPSTIRRFFEEINGDYNG